MTWFNATLNDSDFEELYRAELPRVYNFFRYRIGDGQLAEDLTSETFEKAWRNRARYRSDLAAFSTWLFTIARRVAQDHFRRHHNEIPLNEISNISDNESMEDIAQQDADFAQIWRGSHQPRHRTSQRADRIQCGRNSVSNDPDPTLRMGA